MLMSRDGKIESISDLLEKPYHLSYPFVFEWNGQQFLIPESAENRTVELYRFSKFPTDVEFVHNLAEDVSLYDATLVEHEGLWWMFANARPHEDASDRDELCVFFAEHPMSRTWRPHPMNPIVSDVRTARPAGRIYSKDGTMLRPAQNSSVRYGFGINICRIVELTTTHYREEVIEELSPKWSPAIDGLHTMNRCDNFTVIDARRRAARRPIGSSI
jgi:hypothetical protein